MSGKGQQDITIFFDQEGKRKRKESSESTSAQADLELKRNKIADSSILEGSELELSDMEEEIRPVVAAVLKQFQERLHEQTAQFASETMKLVQESILEAMNEIGVLHEKISRLERENGQLKGDLESIKAKQFSDKQALEREINHMEQYTRKDSVRVFGIQETKNEDTTQKVCETLSKLLEIPLSPVDISACHRLPSLGTTTPQKPRTILIRFSKRFKKEQVIWKRKKLKGKGVSVGDDITKKNIGLINRAERSGNFESVWYFNGKVRAKKKNGGIVILDLYQSFS